jgi:hypothetical protein
MAVEVPLISSVQSQRRRQMSETQAVSRMENFWVHWRLITCDAKDALLQIGCASVCPFQTSPRVQLNSILISCNLFLLERDHVRPLPIRSLCSCRPLACQLCLRPKETVRSLLYCSRKRSGAQLNDSFTIPVNIPKPLLPCEVHVRPHKTLSPTPNINTTTDIVAPIADPAFRATYRDLESSATAQGRE